MSAQEHDHLRKADETPETSENTVQPTTADATEITPETTSEVPLNVIEISDEALRDDTLMVEDNSDLLGSQDPIAAMVPPPAEQEAADDEQRVTQEVSEAEEGSANEKVSAPAEVSDTEKTAQNENEDEDEAHMPDEVPDYESMDMEALIEELDKLLQREDIVNIRAQVEHLRVVFQSKMHHFIEEKKDEFFAENPEGEFEYHTPLRKRFDDLYYRFRDKKNAHFKNVQQNLEENLRKRTAIVEELKNLINPQENIKDTLKHFNELRDQWKTAGPIPKDKYNHVWNNYHFHVENFYDYLHLDREARDLDFKHNLEQKQRIIERAEALLTQPDINKSFRELQNLHRMWKEEIGPVAREVREDIWNQFSEITRQMHQQREDWLEAQRGKESENLEQKRHIIEQIQAVAEHPVKAHSEWQGQIDKIEKLRESFFALGKVPPEDNEATWSAFKAAVRTFNANKNAFYKDSKKEQQDNLSKKLDLVEKAKALRDSEDFATATPLLKQYQEEWKHIGHVPRKFSDKIWKEFKEACNHYFERLKQTRNHGSEEEAQAFENKKNYMETLRSFEMTGDHKTDLDAIKAHIEAWKAFGKVPFPKRHIEGKFNKILDVLFEKLSQSKKDGEMLRFASRMDHLSQTDDKRKIDNEKIFLMRKIDEVQAEIFQLENNIQFFANAKKDNPMVAEVHKNIDKHKEELSILKEKLKQIRQLQQPS